MKKITKNIIHWDLYQTNKFLLKMKLTLVISLVAVIQVAASSYAQTTTLSLHFKDASIGEILKAIEEQSEFDFFYNNDQIQLDKKVNLKVKKGTVNEILDELLKKSGLDYKIIKKDIVITPGYKSTENQEHIKIQESQEETKISGTVTDKSGFGLPGVNIYPKGSTSKGTITDINGNYAITLNDPNAILVFSFVGYKTLEVPLNGRTIIDITLEEELLGMEEVVVTALGIKRSEKSLGYAVTQVKADEILNARETNVVNALAGKVAGVQINSSSGMAGSSSRIVIRGNTSIFFENQPLFVIDGVPIDNSENTQKSNLSFGPSGNTALDIDPNTIESMSILKGASASALYGSKAANGVILITTKEGTKDSKPVITVNTNWGWDNIIKPKLQGTWAQGEYLTYFNGEDPNQKTSLSWGPKIADVPGAQKYDHFDIFQTGQTIENSVSMSGGGKKATYFTSFTDYRQEGTLNPIKFKRRSLLAKASFDLSDKLKVTSSVNYINMDNDRLFEGNSHSSVMNTLTATPLTYNMYPAVDELGNQRVYRGAGQRDNYLWLLENTGTNDIRNRFLTTLGIDYSILPGLKLTGKFGTDFYLSQEKLMENTGNTGDYRSGRHELYNRAYLNMNSDIMLMYDKEFGDFKTNFMIGNNISANKIDENGTRGTDFIISGYYDLANTQSKYSWTYLERKRSVSLFGQAVVSWKDLLYLTVTGRNDWSSTLPKGQNSFFYPSVSLGMVFSELMENKDILSFGKIRTSYAEVGNSAVPYATFSRNVLPEIQSPWRGRIDFPFNGTSGFVQSRLAGNPNLKNELTKEFEIGADLRFLNNRLGIDMAYYHKTSVDQIIEKPLPFSSGFDLVYDNIGKMTNKGVELLFYATPVKTGNFSWDITVNWAKNVNKVVKLDDEIKQVQLEGYTGEGPYIVEGQEYPVIWGTSAVRDAQGRYVINDAADADWERGMYLVDWEKSGVLGSVLPDWTGGFRNTFTFKGLTFSAFFDIRKGGKVLNLDEHYLFYYGTSYLTENRPDDLMVTLDGVKGYFDENGNLVTTEENDIEVDMSEVYRWNIGDITEFYVQKTDYIKLREVSISYSVPKSLLEKSNFLKGINISVIGRNLWHKYDDGFTGSDPEGSLAGSTNGQGIINYMMPSTKSVNVNVKFTF